MSRLGFVWCKERNFGGLGDTSNQVLQPHMSALGTVGSEEKRTFERIYICTFGSLTNQS